MSKFGTMAGGGVTVTAFIAYMALGLFQMAAVIGGLEDWLVLHWLIALILAFPISYMPVIGTVLGVFGAHSAWGWSWGLSLALFFAPMLIIFAIGLTAFGIGKARNRLAR
jgi:hypothetical protein